MNKDEASEGKEIIKSVSCNSLVYSSLLQLGISWRFGFWVNLSVLLNPYFQLCFKFISTSARGFAKLSYIYIITLKPTLFRRLEISSQLSKPCIIILHMDMELPPVQIVSKIKWIIDFSKNVVLEFLGGIDSNENGNKNCQILPPIIY